MNDIELTILMPCLNEEKTIGFCISEAQEYIKKSGISAEILIANNGSCDKRLESRRLYLSVRYSLNST